MFNDDVSKIERHVFEVTWKLLHTVLGNTEKREGRPSLLNLVRGTLMQN